MLSHFKKIKQEVPSLFFQMDIFENRLVLSSGENW